MVTLFINSVSGDLFCKLDTHNNLNILTSILSSFPRVFHPLTQVSLPHNVQFFYTSFIKPPFHIHNDSFGKCKWLQLSEFSPLLTNTGILLSIKLYRL